MNLFRRTQQTHQSSASASRLRRQRRQRPGLESLEGRQLLALTPPITINTFPVDFEDLSANATNTHGLSVVAWVDRDFSDGRIFAQLLNSDGSKRGSQITVESSNFDHSEPAVAIDANGDFVVVYTEREANGLAAIVGKRFNSLGQQIGGRVANLDVPDGQGHFDPSVAMDNAGDFVVTYTTEAASTGLPAQKQVVGRRFNSSGQFVRPILLDNFFNNNDDSQARVSSDHNGFIAIVFTKENRTTRNSEIDLAEFGPDGTGFGNVTAISGHLRVSNPSVAVNDGDSVVIAYEFNDGNNGGNSTVGVQRFSYGSESPVENPIVVNGNTGSIATTSVTLLTNGVTAGDDYGPFVVAYNFADSSEGPFAQLKAFGSLESGDTVSEVDNIPDAFNEFLSPVTVSSDRTGTDKFLLTYTSVSSSGVEFSNIAAREGFAFFAPAAKNLALTPTIQAGQLAHLTGSLTDAAGDTNLTLTVNWGDGAMPQQSKPGLKPFDVTHKYLKPGIYKVHVTWSDEHGQSNSRDLMITVKAAPNGH